MLDKTQDFSNQGLFLQRDNGVSVVSQDLNITYYHLFFDFREKKFDGLVGQFLVHSREGLKLVVDLLNILGVQMDFEKPGPIHFAPSALANNLKRKNSLNHARAAQTRKRERNKTNSSRHLSNASNNPSGNNSYMIQKKSRLHSTTCS